MDIKLTSAQKKAYNKLQKTKDWMSPYDLRESMGTLNALERKGLIRVRGYGRLGAMFSPRTTIEYKWVR